MAILGVLSLLLLVAYPLDASDWDCACPMPYDPSIEILVSRTWPRRDVNWFLDGVRRLHRFPGIPSRQEVEMKEEAEVVTEVICGSEGGSGNGSDSYEDRNWLLYGLTKLYWFIVGGDRRRVPEFSCIIKNDSQLGSPPLDKEEIHAITTFTEETQLGSVIRLAESDTTGAQIKALVVGEEALLKQDEINTRIRKDGVSLEKGSASLKHQLAFSRTSNIATEMARLGTIRGAATTSFTESFGLPTSATVGLPLLGQVSNCSNIQTVFCAPSSPYRTYDGRCNNLGSPLQGAAFTSYRRALPPSYDDGESTLRKAVSGAELPSARLVSTNINVVRSEHSKSFSILHMTFGQFIDHDLTATPLNRVSPPGYPSAAVRCCPSPHRRFPIHPECAPIDIPEDDPFYGCYGQTCMEFVRSAAAGSCLLGPRDQINQHSAYLDGSVIYGVKEPEVSDLRISEDGLLKVQVTAEGQMLLPMSAAEDGCNTQENMDAGEHCFKAGDGRVNEQILLTFFQTLWAREHNRIARNLKLQNGWDDEKLYQEARRIVVAELQQVTYNEFLPTIIGPALMAVSNLNPLTGLDQTTDYSSNIDASIANGFAAAAYRFGHSLIADDILSVSKYGQATFQELSTLYFNPFQLYSQNGMCDIAKGGTDLPELNMDPYFTPEVAGKLFRGDLPFGLDLLALNIQRGRDHGLPPYNKWRQFCGLPAATDFNGLLAQMSQENVDALKATYQHVDDIDIYAGGISENPVAGSILGHTFTCIIHDQFLRIKRGDRYWFEYKDGPGKFTNLQVRQLHKVTLAKIMCNNIPELKTIQRWPLRNPGPNNPEVCCNSIPQYYLRAWRDLIVLTPTSPLDMILENTDPLNISNFDTDI